MLDRFLAPIEPKPAFPRRRPVALETGLGEDWPDVAVVLDVFGASDAGKNAQAQDGQYATQS